MPPMGALPLVDISHRAIEIDLAYATARNFTGRVPYAEARAP